MQLIIPQQVFPKMYGSNCIIIYLIEISMLALIWSQLRILDTYQCTNVFEILQKSNTNRIRDHKMISLLNCCQIYIHKVISELICYGNTQKTVNNAAWKGKDKFINGFKYLMFILMKMSYSNWNEYKYRQASTLSHDQM